MLEEVREAGASLPFVGRAHVIPDVHRGDRDAGVAVQDHVQPVGQLELPEGDFERGGLRCGRTRLGHESSGRLDEHEGEQRKEHEAHVRVS